MPAVSVIVPTHNRASLLRRAIDSVRRQTVGDFEIIVVDDASSDDTAGVVRGYGDPRIRYIKLPGNGGVASTRNAGIAAAAGDFIALLDDDDEWLPEKLQRQVDLFDRGGPAVGAVYSGYREIDQATSDVIAERLPAFRGQIFENLLVAGRFTPTSTIMVRTECFRRLGGFDPAFRYGEDYDMWLRVAREYEIDFVNDCLTNVYFQPSGLTQNYQAIISGSELHLERYRDFFASHRSVYSAQLQRLGTLYCFTDRVTIGRSMFIEAIRLDPRSIKNYVCLALSFLGGNMFRASYSAKDRLLA